MKSLTILFPPMDGIGHVNACIGVAEELQKRGHRIVFAINEQWKGKLNRYGFEEELISDPERDSNIDPAKYWAQIILKSGAMSDKPPLEKFKAMGSETFRSMIMKNKDMDPIMEQIVNRVKPDVIIIDNFVAQPSLINYGKPWIFLWSGGPLLQRTTEKRLPPAGSGYSAYDTNGWDEFREEFKLILQPMLSEYSEFIVSKGLKPIENGRMMNPSPYLNIYAYPEEIDYTDIVPMPPKWFRLDYFKRSDNFENFEVPDKLKAKQGKLVYVSMGSMGSIDVNLMKRFVSALAKSPNRFIISKGPLGDEYELADNMWGEKFVPQVKVLPHVDLVITHGGNNTVTESLYFGKPLIVMPLFGDQYDNAQRIHEKGFGIRLTTYSFSDEELIIAVDKLLNDKELAIRINNMANRIQTSNCLQKVCAAIENIATHN